MLEALKKEEGLARAKLHNAAVGVNVENHPGRLKKREEAEERLRQVVDRYGKLPIKEYVALVISFYNN